MWADVAILGVVGFLVGVAVTTVTVAALVTYAVLWGAGQVGTARDIAQGATEIVENNPTPFTHRVVDRWDDPEWWQRHDVNREGGGGALVRQLAGAAKIVKGVSGLASPAGPPNPVGGFADGRTVADGVQTITDYVNDAATGTEPSTAAGADQAPQPQSTDDEDVSTEAPAPTTICSFVGSVEGSELVCREVWPETQTPSQDDQPATSSGSPDGTYYVQPTGEAAMYVRSGDLEWHPTSNYVTVDTTAESGWTVEGFIANGPDPATGAGYSTEYSLSSTETPWWDDDQGMWRLTVMVSQDGREPEICEAYITRTGSLSVTYDIGGFPVTLGGSREG